MYYDYVIQLLVAHPVDSLLQGSLFLFFQYFHEFV